MSIILTPIEARVLGCLLEKAVVTPDQYPLSLNALTNACNQKSARHPVMALEAGEVQRAVRTLEDKHIVVRDENFKTQVEKYTHRFCNTAFSDYQFDPAQYAIVTLLLLRGPRTPGELRANSGRLHTFADNDAVLEALQSLQSDPYTIVTQLPRVAGRRDNEYMHQFYAASLDNPSIEATPPAQVNSRQSPGELRPEATPVKVPVDTPVDTPVDKKITDNLATRVASLEIELAQLKNLVQQLIANHKD